MENYRRLAHPQPHQRSGCPILSQFHRERVGDHKPNPAQKPHHPCTVLFNCGCPILSQPHRERVGDHEPQPRSEASDHPSTVLFNCGCPILSQPHRERVGDHETQPRSEALDSPFHSPLQLPASRVNIPPARTPQISRNTLSRQRSPKFIHSRSPQAWRKESPAPDSTQSGSPSQAIPTAAPAAPLPARAPACPSLRPAAHTQT